VAYTAYPGYLSNAQDFFGASNCPDHSTYAVINCDGDGNDRIGSIYTTDGKQYEHAYVFKHMSLAEVWKGGFSPESLSTSLPAFTVSDLNTPTFNIDGVTGYFALWGTNGGSGAYKYLYNAVTDSTESVNEGKPCGAAFKGTTAYKIDKKIDDGVRDTGSFLGGGWNRS